MWAQNILLAVIGLSAGVIVASGLFSFVIELGVVSDFASHKYSTKNPEHCCQYIPTGYGYVEHPENIRQYSAQRHTVLVEQNVFACVGAVCKIGHNT